eukprot:g9765.t1
MIDKDIGSSMKATLCTTYGPALTSFEYKTDCPKPKIQNPKQILILNKYTTVNPADCKQRSGNLQLVLKHQFPFILSQDFAGTIVEVGTDVKDYKVGDDVYGCTNGANNGKQPRNSCAAEYLITYENEICKKPENISFMEAATIPTGFCTAYKGLFDKQYGNLKITKEEVKDEEKKQILILGASGSVGSSAVQLAVKLAQCNVVAFCSNKNFEYVEKLGGTPIDYNVDFVKHLSEKNMKFDLILDCVGGDEYYYKLYPFLKPKSGNTPTPNYITCVGPVLHGGAKRITVGTIIGTIRILGPRFLNEFIFGSSRYKMYLSFTTANGVLKEITNALEQQVIVPARIDPMSPFPLNKLNEAHAKVEQGHSDGKVIVEIS